MFLSTQELTELTGKIRKDAQIRALRSMGIDHIERPDGSAAVAKDIVLKALGAVISKPSTRVEPNWSAING